MLSSINNTMKKLSASTRCLVVLAGLSGSVLSLSANAAEVSQLNAVHITDSQLTSLIGSSAVFAAMGQLGDAIDSTASTGGGPGTRLSSLLANGSVQAAATGNAHELGLGYALSEPASTRQFDWGNGNTETFWLNFDADNSKITYSLGGKTMKYMAPEPFGFSDLVIRTQANNENESFLSDLMINGTSIGSTYSNGGGADVLHVNGLDFSRSFSLIGNAMLAWQGALADQDAGFSLQFIQAVPEPAQVLMLLAGIAVIGTFSRLRKNQSMS